ncbi:transglutaminase domain-containing protein [Nocardioides sp. ChNu-153]|uniref:DUF3488 and transglutaminase-like domain-containing protein n=3 Tax=unclassified Nocardioides TaxID=2615069 RepID=UPI002651F5D3|nr:transglutaminase domain-containing protein [Nocardioides sp. ChNu-153]MDN7122842.1 transglutaminase domain-containing protein [Nocardioides sp. ChNu-153]
MSGAGRTERAGLPGAAALVWSASLPAAGALSVATAWGGWRMPLLVVAAVVVPFALLVTVVRLGVGRWAATAALTALLVLVAYVLGAGAGTTFVGTVGDAVPLLLTEPQPLALRADLLVAPVLACGLVGIAVGLRSVRPTRLAPLVGGLVLYAAGAFLTGGRGDRVGVVAALLLVLAVLGWCLLDETGEPRRRRLVLAGPVLVVAVGVVASTALVPVSGAFDPRSVVEPPIVRTDVSSPLPQLAAWAANPDVELFTTAGDTGPTRLVVLDEYDGTQWRAATRYGPFGATADDVLPAGEQRRRSTMAVRVAELGGSWLPAPGTPTGVSGTEALVDPRTGTLLEPAGAADAEYEVTAEVDDPDPARLPGATLPDPSADLPLERYLELPDVPTDLWVYAGQVTAGATTPYQRAVAVEDAVRGQRRVAERAISGSALWRVEDFLLGEVGTAGAQEGTSEQFATAFALVARYAGLPTRLVVGFEPGDEQPDGTRVVRGEHALAWPEVYFDRLGWVAFSPTPDADLGGERPDAPLDPPTTPPPAPTPSADPSPDQVDDHAADDAGGSTLPPRTGAFAAGALLLAVPLGLLLARALRSWGHRRRGARGAWAEVLDALVLAGRPAPRSTPAPVVGDGVAMRYGAPAATRLARAADRAAFAPGSTGAGAPTTEDRRAVREVRRAVRRSVPWWRRAWWYLDPRVLRRR